MRRMRVTVFVAIAPLLSACASSGLYNMTEAWCAQHVSASATRCPDHQPERIAERQERMTAETLRSNN